jgi:Glycosyl transferase 4-like domain
MIDSQPRILIIYPYSSLDTNPTMTFLIESLAARKVRVDVLAGQRETFATPESFLTPQSFGETVQLEFLPYDFFFRWWSPVRGLPLRLATRFLVPGTGSRYSLRFDHAFFKYFQAARYSVIIGVDPHGIVLADALNRWTKKPLVYISFEILFSDDVDSARDQELLRLERAACQRSSLVLTQDDERAQAFCRETSFPLERLFTIPVAPPPQQIERLDFLRRNLKIPPEKRIVLYCGNLQSWSSRDELAELVSYWPDEYCLVIHNRSNVQRTLQGFLDRLTETGKIIVSATPVGRKEMGALVGSADFGLAPYKPVPGDLWTGTNLYHLGFASGKVSYYALCGLPMLARPLPVFEREFSRYKCGKIYHRLSESGNLLEEMTRDYEHYSREAVRFYAERLNPVNGMNKFCDRLMELARGGAE